MRARGVRGAIQVSTVRCVRARDGTGRCRASRARANPRARRRDARARSTASGRASRRVARRRAASCVVGSRRDSLSLSISRDYITFPRRATARDATPRRSHRALDILSKRRAQDAQDGPESDQRRLLRGRRAEGGSVPAHEQLYRHEDVRDRRDGRGEDPSDERETAEHRDAAREGGPAGRGDAPRERWGARVRPGTVSRRRDGARGDDARSRRTRGRARARRARRGNARERDGREAHGHTDVGDEWMEKCGFRFRVTRRRGARALFVRGGTRRTTE